MTDQPNLYGKVDHDGKQCNRCGEGTYEIADLNDELNGERHCNKCGHFVKRYEMRNN